MNFTYLELATLKYAASKLLECVHQIEAVNITTGGNPVLVPQEYLDSLLDDVDSASKTIMQVTAINGDENEKSISANSDRVSG
jgi:antitoxin (DNA-binding transcriptional repressor) of toxin-antitoxin stability system